MCGKRWKGDLRSGRGRCDGDVARCGSGGRSDGHSDYRKTIRKTPDRHKDSHIPTAPHVPVVSEAVVVAAASDVAVAEAASLAPADALTPATAALISSVVASSTSRFCVKMQPSWSFASSHELPFAVGSPIWPGANVPDMRASVGSPPTDAICFASSSVMALFVAAALSEAGSCKVC